MRFKEGYLPERSLAEQRFYRQKIAVPAAVMKHRQQSAKAFRQRIQLASLRQRHGKGFIDDDMLTGFQRRLRQREMGVVRRGDHN